MDFVRFEYLIALDECKSFSRAAEKCFISQPALTKSINKLEESLGVRLFDRSKTPIALTYAGEHYLRGVRNIMAMKTQLDLEMAEIAGNRKEHLAVGIPESRGQKWLGQILPLYAEAYPDVDIQIFESTSQGLEEALIEGKIDLIIVSTLPILTPGIDYEALASESLLFVLPPVHEIFGDVIPPAMRDTVYHLRPEQLRHTPFISPLKTQGLYRASRQIFEKHGMMPRILLETVNPDTAASLASEGLGFSLTTMNLSNFHAFPTVPLLGTLDVPPFERTLIASWKRGKPLSFPARKLIDLTRECMRNHPELDYTAFRFCRPEEVGELM